MVHLKYVSPRLCFKMHLSVNIFRRKKQPKKSNGIRGGKNQVMLTDTQKVSFANVIFITLQNVLQEV